MIKTCTHVLQQWHAPGQLSNKEPILSENLTFKKADTKTGKKKLRKKQIHTGKGIFLLKLHLPQMVLLENDDNNLKMVKKPRNLYGHFN